MSGFEVVTTINREPDDVFTFLLQFDRRHEWEPGVIEARQSPAGAVRAGTKVFKSHRFLKAQTVTTVAVVELDADRHRYTERVMDGSLHGSTATWSVERLGRVTRVRAYLEIQANGPWKLVPPLAAWDAR